MPTTRRRTRGSAARPAVFPEYPLLPLRETVLFPKVVTPLLVGRERSLFALDGAMDDDQMIVVVAQKDSGLADPAPENLYTIGTLVEIGRLLHMPDGATSILAQGVQRVKILEFLQTEPYPRVRVMPIFDPNETSATTEPLVRAVRTLFEQLAQLSGQVSSGVSARNIPITATCLRTGRIYQNRFNSGNHLVR